MSTSIVPRSAGTDLFGHPHLTKQTDRTPAPELFARTRTAPVNGNSFDFLDNLDKRKEAAAQARKARFESQARIVVEKEKEVDSGRHTASVNGNSFDFLDTLARRKAAAAARKARRESEALVVGKKEVEVDSGKGPGQRARGLQVALQLRKPDTNSVQLSNLAASHARFPGSDRRPTKVCLVKLADPASGYIGSLPRDRYTTKVYLVGSLDVAADIAFASIVAGHRVRPDFKFVASAGRERVVLEAQRDNDFAKIEAFSVSSEKDYVRRLSDSTSSEASGSIGSSTLVDSPVKARFSPADISDDDGPAPAQPAQAEPALLAKLQICSDPYGVDRKPQKYNGRPRNPRSAISAPRWTASESDLRAADAKKPEFLQRQQEEWMAEHRLNQPSGRRPRL